MAFQATEQMLDKMAASRLASYIPPDPEKVQQRELYSACITDLKIGARKAELQFDKQAGKYLKKLYKELKDARAADANEAQIASIKKRIAKYSA